MTLSPGRHFKGAGGAKSALIKVLMVKVSETKGKKPIQMTRINFIKRTLGMGAKIGCNILQSALQTASAQGHNNSSNSEAEGVASHRV